MTEDKEILNKRFKWLSVKRLGLIVAILAVLVTIYIYSNPITKPDFEISVYPLEGSINQGGVIQTTITVKAIGDYGYPVSLSSARNAFWS